ncbi:MAG: FtsX-like permease family protein [Thermoproteota archaeon]
MGKEIIPVLFFICLLISLSSMNVSAQKETAIISGRVTDVKGNPISEASVIVIDWYRQRVLSILKTGPEGQYEIEVEAGAPNSYRVYAYKEENGRIVFSPSTLEEKLSPKSGDRLILNLKLVPGAALNVTGEVWNVFTAKYSISLKIQVVDPESGSILKGEEVGDYTPFYGDNVTSYFVNPRWLSPPFAPGYWTIVSIPANRPVEIRVIASQPGIPDQVFTLRDGDNPFNLPQGAIKNVDITESSYRWSLFKVEDASRYMWGKIYDAERFGFFLLLLKDDATKKVDKQIEKARQMIDAGEVSPELQRILRESYIYATRYIVNEIESMKSIAEKGALFLPIFLTIFSIMLALFITEKSKLTLRIPLFITIFIIVTVCFYYIYPGIPLIIERFSSSFYLSVSIVFISGILFLSMLQKIVYEASSPTSVPLRSALAVAFTLGKRYVKLRRFSSTLIIISICILIATATTLTSVTSIFGLNSETIGASSGEWVLIKNPSETEGLFIPIDTITMSHVKNETGVRLISPKIESLPTIGQYSVRLLSGGREATILGIIGIYPEIEGKFLATRLTEEKPHLDDNSVWISYTTASMLRLTGDNTTLKFSSGGFVFEIPLKVSGVFLDEDFNNEKDLNGEPYSPNVFLEGKLARCNASQVIFLSFNKTLQLSSKPYSLPLSISRMIIEFEDQTKVSNFIETQAWARGFHVWFSHEGRLLHYYLGTKIEIRFLDVLPPLIIVMLFISRLMYDIVERRKKEVFIYTTLGFNPMHIALVFIAESATMGLLGGGFGYLFGLTLFRVLRYVSEASQVGVSENLHWEASILSILAGFIIAVVSAIMPSLKAATLAVPSLTRKIKMSREEEVKRYEEIYRAYGERVLFIPVRVKRIEVEFLVGHLYNKLKERAGGFSERVEDLGQVEIVKSQDGTETYWIGFRYVVINKGQKFSTSNKIRIECKPGEDWFRMYLHSVAEQEGMPEVIRERVMRIVSEISLDWVKKRPSPSKYPPKL